MFTGTDAKAATVSFRIITSEDEEFVFQVYAATRDYEMAQLPWSAEEKDRFLRGQFFAQSKHFAEAYLQAAHRIIQLGSADIGRLIVNRADDHLRIIDLSLLPFYRSRGIGTDILRSLLNEAHGGKVPTRLHVRKESRAIALYARHGFKVINDKGHYWEMEWKASPAAKR